ncbi:putative flippase GtrA [Jatrophihabitans sp. GAS493]|uniref:GtrA family protein n=1 Tax=Jatrophihabitans sp. GAS493 TaxID=1907575 RepID=UPI000BB7A168|nr:GtrA family protein [Jatrophihabitans sp. GAS493]SOD72983.1 putative flippase GtrA [Jatrophihabitans sp. GAS493]
MTPPTHQHSLSQRIRDSWRILLKEMTSFGVVGAIGLIVDLGTFHFLLEHGRIKAKIISTILATIITYVGNRYFSFSHRARSGLRREAGFFLAINVVVLLASLVVIWFFSYPLGFDENTTHDRAVIQIVNLFTIGLGTIFRFWAYKRFVFLHPDRVHSPDVNLDEELAE